MIYRAIQQIQIFLADGRTNGRTKVIQEVLADLKTSSIHLHMGEAETPVSLLNHDNLFLAPTPVSQTVGQSVSQR